MAVVVLTVDQASYFSSSPVLMSGVSSPGKVVGVFGGLKYNASLGFLSGGLPSFYARYAAGGPVGEGELDLELYCENQFVARTTTGANGQWRFDNLDISKRYDIVVKHATLEGTLSRNRLPAPYPLSVGTLTLSGNKNITNANTYRGTVFAKHWRGTLTATAIVGSVGIVSVDQKTGRISLDITWDPGNTVVVRVQDAHSFVDVDVTAGSRTDPNWSKNRAILRFNNIGTPTSFPDEANPSNSWTPTGTVTVSSAKNKFGGYSALFSGGNSFLTGPAFNLGKEWTIECWANIPALASPGLILMSMYGASGTGGGTSLGSGFTINLGVSAAGKLYYQVMQCLVFGYKNSGYFVRWSNDISIPAEYRGPEGPDDVILNEWNHFAMTCTPYGLYVHLNGKLQRFCPIKEIVGTNFASMVGGNGAFTMIGAGTRVTHTSPPTTGSTSAVEWYVPNGTHIDSALITSWAKYPMTQFTPPVNDFLGAP